MYYITFSEVRKVKNNKNQTNEKKPYIKTKEKSNGGIEVELRTSPSKTLIGKIFAFAIAFITLFGGLFGLIYLFTQM